MVFVMKSSDICCLLLTQCLIMWNILMPRISSARLNNFSRLSPHFTLVWNLIRMWPTISSQRSLGLPRNSYISCTLLSRGKRKVFRLEWKCQLYSPWWAQKFKHEKRGFPRCKYIKKIIIYQNIKLAEETRQRCCIFKEAS